jgi:Fic family protein
MKNNLRDNYKFYSQDLLNHLFKQPYTKIEYLVSELNISRVTASGYLNKLAEDGVLKKQKVGKYNYYLNEELVKLLTK